MMGAIRLAFMAVWARRGPPPYVRCKLLDGALVLGAGLLILTAFGLTIVVQVATETSTKIAAGAGSRRPCDRRDRSAGHKLGASLALVFAASRCSTASSHPSRSGSSTSCPALLQRRRPSRGRRLLRLSRPLRRLRRHYGPLGAVLAFLLLVWLTAAILLAGAAPPPASRPPSLSSSRRRDPDARPARAAKRLVIRDGA